MSEIPVDFVGETEPESLNEIIDQLHRCIVVDKDYELIGSVGQVYLDDITRQPSWVTVNTGFLGLREVFVPVTKATIEEDQVLVSWSKDTVLAAPSIDPDGHLGPEDEQELLAYYLEQTAPELPEAEAE